MLAMVEEEHEKMEEVFGLTSLQKNFALAYFEGPTAGNATRSWMRTSGEESADRAGAIASEVLKHPRVAKFLVHLHEAAIVAAVDRKLTPWGSLVPLAQGVIVATAQGKLRNRLAYEAAIHILDRALGKPTERHTLELMDESRVNGLLRSMSARVEGRTMEVVDAEVEVEEDDVPPT